MNYFYVLDFFLNLIHFTFCWASFVSSVSLIFIFISSKYISKYGEVRYIKKKRGKRKEKKFALLLLTYIHDTCIKYLRNQNILRLMIICSISSLAFMMMHFSFHVLFFCIFFCILYQDIHISWLFKLTRCVRLINT